MITDTFQFHLSPIDDAFQVNENCKQRPVL
jgi:hypothetical protein